jgi:hypothetical protein
METAVNLSPRSLQYYIVSRHWGSDLEFFKIETAFFHRLLDDYFVRLLSPEYFENLKKTSSKLFQLEKDENEVRRQLNDHLKQLELTAENIIPEDLEELSAAHSRLESSVIRFINEYREVKKDLFDLVESAMKEKKLIVS